MMNQSVIPITKEEFDSTLLSLHNAIFSRGEDSDIPEEQYRPSMNTSWEKVLVPGDLFYMDDGEFMALAAAALKMGDDRVIVTESESLPHYGDSFKVVWDQRALMSIVASSSIPHFEQHAFGLSGTWGLMCYVDEFSLLGGIPAFMTAYFEAIGGRERARVQFISHAVAAWVSMDPIEQVRILKSVGWSFSDQSP